MPATSRRRASSRWPAPSATSAAIPQSPAGSTPSRAGSASRSGAEASSPLREKSRWTRPQPTSPNTSPIRGRTPSRQRPIGNLRPLSRTPSTRLEPSQREVLVLRDVEGLSAPEVAKILGMSVDAVKSRLHRARVAIREELAPALGRPAIAPPRGTLCPDVLTLFSQHLEGRDRSERVRDDGGTSRAMPSLPRRLRVAEAHAGDLPAVADAGRACIPGRVRQSRHPRVPQPTLTSQTRAGLRRQGGFFPSVRAASGHGRRRSGAIRAICVRGPTERQLHNPSSGVANPFGRDWLLRVGNAADSRCEGGEAHD